MILRANCKINLGLDVLRRREDGFHDLETVMLPVVGLYDIVELEPAQGESELTTKGIAIDCPAEQNLCMKALRLMQQRYGVGEVHITLDKRVPFGAGLGSGSSDATAVILGVNKMFDLSLSEEQLIALASELGSDTAFFVRNTPQLCTSRGEVMRDIELNLKGLYLVVAKPEDAVSTREAYSGVRPFVPQIPLAERLTAPICEWQQNVKNDFEKHIFELHPTIGALKARFIADGALYASMSGSGSAVFGLFESVPYRIENEIIHVEQL